jgi:adenosylcobyric acid synthase
VGFPRISNLDEFQPLRDCAGVRLRWARTAAELEDADWIILPGSKRTSGDRAWMRTQGLDTPILRHAARGGAILGLCGGLQMLGGPMCDPHGVDGEERGLDLLPLQTRFERDKLVRQAHLRFGDVTGAWRALAAIELEGYEIHQGRSDAVVGDCCETGAGETTVALRNGDGEAIGWQRGNVLGLYAHGVFESPAVMRALFGDAPRTLDSVFDGLADFVDRHFLPGALQRLAGLA